MAKQKIQIETAIETAAGEPVGTVPVVTVPVTRVDGVAAVLVEMCERVAQGWKSFRKGELTVSEVLSLVDTLVRGAQGLIAERGQGALKHEAVLQAFETLDRKYGLIDALDEKIQLPGIAGKLLEPFDAMILRSLVGLLIMQVVIAYNTNGWPGR